jgi:hypothetical protein
MGSREETTEPSRKYVRKAVREGELLARNRGDKCYGRY